MISKLRTTRDRTLCLSLILSLSSQLLTSPSANCQTIDNQLPVSAKRKDTFGHQIAGQISKSWNFDSKTNMVAEALTFNITKDGYPCDIRLTSGFDNPEAIKAALRAVLSAMPFNPSSKPVTSASKTATYQATCSFKGDPQKPEVTVCLSETDIDQAELEQELLAKLPYKEKQSQADSIVRVWLVNQLLYLNECQFKLPESRAIAERISSSLQQAGLSSQNPRDWIALARLLDPQIPIARNPDKTIMVSCNGCINAYLQAWKLDHNADTLDSLATIYDKKLACDCLYASKADPVILATAAMLTNQFSEALELLDTATKKGRADAEILVEQLAATTKSTAEIAKKKSAAIARSKTDDIDWKTILEWLPADTETAIVVRNPITDPVEKERINKLGKPEDQLTRIGAELPDIDNANAKKLFEKSKIVLSIGTGRAFRTPSGLGLGKYQGAKILVFAKENQSATNQIMAEYRKDSRCRKFIEGFEVLVFDSKYTEHMSKLSKYIFSPTEGVIVNATDENYARQMLERINNSPKESALDSNLPFWKHLNTKNNFWAIRKFDKSAMPFDQTAKTYPASLSRDVKEEDWGMKVDPKAIGLTVESRPDKTIVIRFFSDDQSALQNKIEMWKRLVSSNRSNPQAASAATESQNNPEAVRASIDKNMATIEFKIGDRDDGSILLMILSSLGYLIYL
ncbi:MAG: hypothetical protein C0508_04855 [Cyanobacteria bacterium PR.023]|nr:hypothetical protein [Cyanobacteria bacterium PR.023]